MNEKQIYQQRILAKVLIVCAGIIIFTSYITNRSGSIIITGFLFLIIGTLNLMRVKKAEEQLKK